MKMEKNDWYENWKKSAAKWIGIVKAVTKKRPFDTDFGYSDLTVTGECGHCREHHLQGCNHCRLFKTKIRWRRVCNGASSKTWPLNPHFHCFMDEMHKPGPDFKIRKPGPDFKKALKHAEIILRTVLGDCPNRAQAEKDRIKFIVHGVFIPVEYTR